jgi:hypothetical protein
MQKVEGSNPFSRLSGSIALGERSEDLRGVESDLAAAEGARRTARTQVLSFDPSSMGVKIDKLQERRVTRVVLAYVQDLEATHLADDELRLKKINAAINQIDQARRDAQFALGPLGLSKTAYDLMLVVIERSAAAVIEWLVSRLNSEVQERRYREACEAARDIECRTD